MSMTVELYFTYVLQRLYGLSTLTYLIFALKCWSFYAQVNTCSRIYYFNIFQISQRKKYRSLGESCQR